MKTFTLLSLSLIIFCFSINTHAAEYKFVANDNTNVTKICIAAVTDNTNVMKRKIRRLGLAGKVLSRRTIINSIQCNNQYIGNFAKTYNAQNTFAYLDKYTNKRNKKRQANITIKDIAKAQGMNNEKTIVVLVGSK